MFEELPYILGFMIFSVLISYVLLTYTPEPLIKIIQGLSIIGIVIHELCHIVMCIITNTHIESVSLVKRVKIDKPDKQYGYGGHVNIRDEHISFLQGFLTGFAPLYFSFWLFFFLWEQISNPQIEAWLFFVYLFVMISISFSAAPSFGDLALILKAFYNDVRYSLYQIFLVLISIFLVLGLTYSYSLNTLHEVFIYIFIFFAYNFFKYGFKGINYFIQNIHSDKKGSPRFRKRHYRDLTRRRRKPQFKKIKKFEYKY
ncbi:MAG: hypothetical protein ACXAC5_18935 [Promethearchaeota archaeon]|jgi:hypothetical protein